ncbi:DUF305 domain-containing protein [Mariniluteicoccus flavus]
MKMSMRSRGVRRILAAASIPLLLAAAGCSGHEGHGGAAPAGPATAAAADHNDADVMFAQMMIPHHQQAVEMSDILLAKPGVRDDLAQLARQIKGAQQPEIDTMTGWLKTWGASSHGDHAGHGGMDGMLTPAELAALRSADTAAAQKQYVSGMIKHHEGAVTMAKEVQQKGRSADVKKMADDIIRTQQAEITTMKGMLATL